MKHETFHLKVVADCSITICSKRFTGAQYSCCPEKESYCVLHSAGTTLVTQGAASDEMVKAMLRSGRDDRDAALKC